MNKPESSTSAYDRNAGTARSFARTTSSRRSACGSGRVRRRQRTRATGARAFRIARSLPGLDETKVTSIPLPGVGTVRDDLVGAFPPLGGELRAAVRLGRIAHRDDRERVDPF